MFHFWITFCRNINLFYQSIKRPNSQILKSIYIPHKTRMIQSAFLLLIRFLHKINQTDVDSSLKPVLTQLFTLHCVSQIEKNLGNLLILGLVAPKQVTILSNK